MLEETELERLTRLETRMVNGFRQLGADPKVRVAEDHIWVDAEAHTVYVNLLCIPLGAILKTLERTNAPPADYRIVYGGATKTFLSWRPDYDV